MKKNIALFLTVYFVLGCTPLEYRDDITYMSPGEANHPDYFVLINGKPCVDMNNSVGLCALRHNESQALSFKLLGQPYSYKLDFRCGNKDGIVFSKIVDVLKGEEVAFGVSEDILAGQRYVNCIGDIFPLDRETSVSSFFEARVRLYDSNYIRPSDIHVTKYKNTNYLVLGEHAYRAKVKTKDKWHYLKKKTYFKFSSDVEFAVVETKNMRRSYYGVTKIRR